MQKTTKKENHSSENSLFEELQTARNENEVRHKICAHLNISKTIQMFGSTDGVWENTLFEFKFDKKLKEGVTWNKSAYGALAQSIYYCRRILNFEFEGVFQIPHSLVIVDKNGGFIVPTKGLEWIIHFDPTDELDCTNNQEWLNYSKDYEFLVGGGFSWSTPPSSQNRLLVELLMEKEILREVSYLDFKDKNQFSLFLKSIKSGAGELPKIQVTQNNFIKIFDQWFNTFASSGDSRRDWVDRFVIDLRDQYELNAKKGILTNKADSWRVPVDTYLAFWKLYKRPPTAKVDEFIVTNKDLLYDVNDQNNNGDFYTPLRLVGLAHQVLSKHIDYKKPRTWWDPAAGGGNLFFKFNHSQKVILSTKFESDASGLKNNPSVKSDLVLTLDFIHHMVEKDLTLTNEWKSIKKIVDKGDEVVFFMNPPFDDQAESRGSNNSLPENFLDEDSVSARALRALHSRFLYRIMSMTKVLDKPVWVACFSKTAWIVGPDSASFYKEWSKRFEYKDGLIISSKVFNGTKAEWPCLFSLWKFDPKKKDIKNPSEMIVPVFDSRYEFQGEKTLVPFDPSFLRLSDLPKVDKKVLGPKDDYVTVAPLKNEFEVSDIVYEDSMPKNALGYLRVVANDVYNSTQRVQIYSSMCGPSNHNGVPIVKENFEDSLFVYGIRKCVRRNWLNDKDEFYFPSKPSKDHENLKRMACVYALIEGAYVSSMDGLKYKNKKYSFRNSFSIPSRLELRNWGAEDIPDEESFASTWIQKNKANFESVEEVAIKEVKKLIRHTFDEGYRAKGDVKRQIWRGDAGIRQLINGLLDFEGAVLSESMENTFKSYIKAKDQLRAEIEKQIYKLRLLLPFESVEEVSQIPVGEVAKAIKRAKSIAKSSGKALKKKASKAE